MEPGLLYWRVPPFLLLLKREYAAAVRWDGLYPTKTLENLGMENNPERVPSIFPEEIIRAPRIYLVTPLGKMTLTYDHKPPRYWVLFRIMFETLGA